MVACALHRRAHIISCFAGFSPGVTGSIIGCGIQPVRSMINGSTSIVEAVVELVGGLVYCAADITADSGACIFQTVRSLCEQAVRPEPAMIAMAARNALCMKISFCLQTLGSTLINAIWLRERSSAAQAEYHRPVRVGY